MATVTNFANAFETTLTADMLGTDLTAQVQTTSGAPASPCYLVIDPHNDDKREYALFDGTFTANSFVTTALANRYLDGSAAASGITHAAGAIVRFAPVAQHFRNIQNSAVWLDEAQTISGAKTFSVDPTLADGSSALSLAEGNAAYGYPVSSEAELTAALASSVETIRIVDDFEITAAFTLPAGRILLGPGRIFGSISTHLVTALAETTFLGVELENTYTTAAAAAINVGTGATNVRVLDCTFKGAKTNAVVANTTGIAGLFVRGCHFDGVNFGVLTNSLATDVKGVVVSNNRFTGILGDAVEFNHPGAGGLVGAVVADNYISVPHHADGTATSGLGIGAAGVENLTITGNVFETIRHQAIHVEDSSGELIISNNVIDGVSSTLHGANDGINVADGRRAVISRNIVTGADRYGIAVDFSAGFSFVKTTVSGNLVGNSGSHGILISADAGFEGSCTCIGNVSTDNTGSGIQIGGSGTIAVVNDNILTGNGAYGLDFAANHRGTVWRDNIMEGNTSGAVKKFNAPLIRSSVRRSFTAVTDGAGTTPWTDVCPLGVGAKLTASIIVTAATDYGYRVIDLSWDGTTLTQTAVANGASGSMGSPNFQASAGGVLQARVYGVSASRTIGFDVQLDGSILHNT